MLRALAGEDAITDFRPGTERRSSTSLVMHHEWMRTITRLDWASMTITFAQPVR